MAEQTISATYHSFSGVDMHVCFGNAIIGELQGISYTVTREKAPLYTMGSADPRSFSRGKRGIAGSFVFLVFDRSALISEMRNQRRNYFANRYELFDGEQEVTEVQGGSASIINPSVGTVGASIVTAGNVPGLGRRGNVITNDKVIASPVYSDQVPPFDIVITAANEYGHIASMSILGIEILNSGSGLSIDDITTDEACTFVATGIKPWSNQMHVDLRNGQPMAAPIGPNLPGAR
jgi:hypothetical protein